MIRVVRFRKIQHVLFRGLVGKKNIYERFIWFDKKTKASEHPNATGLARRFEISLKTAQRDIEFMRDRLDAPLVYDSTRKGYYYENKTFTLPSVFLSADEISSLLIAKKVLRDISGGNLESQLSSIVDKLTAFLDSYSSDSADIDSVISLKHIEYLPADDKVFKTVLEGCLRKRRVRIAYRRNDYGGAGPRIVDPYHIFSYKGTWHLLAHCHRREMIRDFVLGRVSLVELLDEPFKVPESFNPDDYFNSSFGLYRGDKSHRVVLKFSPNAAGWVNGQVWHKDQKMQVMKCGSIELSFTVASFTEVKSEVLKYGHLVEVVAPKKLRDMIRKDAEEIMLLYEK